MGIHKILLVEGVTDVRLFQHWLKLFGRHASVIVVPMGGNDLVNGKRRLELEELKRITPDVFAIVDSERTSQDLPPKQDRVDFANVCHAIGIRCHVMNRRASDNYLSSNAVAQITGIEHAPLTPYERLADRRPGWDKSLNGAIAAAMNKGELVGTDVGDFLESL
jgi:hypothetical protein